MNSSLSCDNYEDCCSTWEKCKEVFETRRKNFSSLVNSMNLVDKSIECPRGDARDFVCGRMDIGLTTIETQIESSLWVKRKATEISTPFPFVKEEGRDLQDYAEESVYESIGGVELFMSLNNRCNCEYDSLCPSNDPDCTTEKIAELLKKAPQKIGQSEKEIYDFITQKVMDEYLR